jgi:hypothetical protein
MNERPTPELIASLTDRDQVVATFQPTVTDDLIPSCLSWIGINTIYDVAFREDGQWMLIPAYNDDFFGFRAPISDFVDVQRLSPTG